MKNIWAAQSGMITCNIKPKSMVLSRQLRYMEGVDIGAAMGLLGYSIDDHQ